MPRLSTWAWLLAVTIACAGVAVVHIRWVLGHFSTDGYLLDSGWLAYLLESADPLLKNPSSVNDLSFYAHHVSPHLFLFGAPFVWLLGLNGFVILAIHEAVFFGLFCAALLWAAYAKAGSLFPTLAFISAFAIGALSNILLQAAGYPHYEIATLSLSTLALVAWDKGWRRLFLACVIWLPLIREDGGFYAAFVSAASWVIAEPERRTRDWRLLLAVFCGGIAVSAASMLFKSQVFPGFDAFQSNFSGQSWSHVSWQFAADRVYAAVTNPNLLPVLVGCSVLAVRDPRYAAGLVLLLPLFVLHMLSVRDEHGQFTLYFALPWLLPAVIWVVLFARRRQLGTATLTEALTLVVVAVAMTAPAQAAVGIPTHFGYVLPWSFERPISDLDEMRRFARSAHRTFGSDRQSGELACATVGVAALIPNDLRPMEIVDPEAGIAGCAAVLLMAGDMHSSAVGAELDLRGFRKVAEFEAVQLWMRPETGPEATSGPPPRR